MNSSLTDSFSFEDSEETPGKNVVRLMEEISQINLKMTQAEDLSREDLLELVNQATTLMIRQDHYIQELSSHYQETLNKLNLEMSQVRDVQESLLPDKAPQLEGVDFASEYLPSGHASGDYYDFLRPTEDLLGCFIADVSGHGAPSAVVMAITRVLVHEHLEHMKSAGEALSKINDLMHQFVPGSLYVTGVYLLYNHRTHEFQYSTAGHPAPIIWKEKDQKASPLEIKPRFPLKFLPDVEYETLESQLDLGDILVFYTDGITELTNDAGEMVQQTGLLEWVTQSPKDTSAGFLWGLLDEASRYTGGVPPEDDFTIVVLKRTD